jgi:hypothetical protein
MTNGQCCFPSVTHDRQAMNTIYYRIPQSVEIAAGIDKNTLVRKQITIYQLGNIVSFPLITPKK